MIEERVSNKDEKEETKTGWGKESQSQSGLLLSFALHPFLPSFFLSYPMETNTMAPAPHAD